jgi:hypothetical protein
LVFAILGEGIQRGSGSGVYPIPLVREGAATAGEVDDQAIETVVMDE